MSPDCIICNCNARRPLYPGIMSCDKCGHVFADFCLSDAELGRLYSRSYFFGSEYSDYVADKKVLQKNFLLRMGVMEQFIDPSRHKKLLEIGCAYGFFLDIARSRFEEVSGIDITEDGIRYARDELGLEVVQGDFIEHDFGERTFDVVCLWDTIEHLRSPQLYLNKISSLTESGSLLALTTGDIGSLNARIKKGSWRLIHPPTHLHYFSKQTLTRILNDYGFDVVYDRYCGSYRSVENIAYNVLVLRKKRPALYRLLRGLGITRLDLYLNLYDIRYVVARRR